jgi:hypothetical protein
MNWLKQLSTRRRRYNELSESIREHLEEKIADLMDRGMTREEAERTACRDFGNVTWIEERSREVWQWSTLESILSDSKYSLRQLQESSWFQRHGHRHIGAWHRRKYNRLQHRRCGDATPLAVYPASETCGNKDK